MALTRSLVSIVSACGLAVGVAATAAPPLVAQATAPSTWCGDGIPANALVERNVVTWPALLGVEIVDSSGSTGVGVCYSSEDGLAGGVLAANLATTSTFCQSDSASLLQPTCTSGATPSYTVYSPCGSLLGCGGALSVSVPFQVCVGSNLTGGSCSGGSPGVGSTGLVLMGLSLAPPPPGTTTGYTVQVSDLDVYLDGITIPIDQGQPSGAGVNFAAFAAGVGGPALLWAGTSSAGPAAVLQIGPTTLPVTLPDNCVSIGGNCPTPY